MLKSMLKTGVAALLVAAIAGMPAGLLAQNASKPAAEKEPAAATKEAPAKKKAAHPFRGKLAEVDTTARTIKIGKSVYQITSETKITKGGKPATLEDGVVGEPVTGYVKPTEDGKMAASTVRFNPKPEAEGVEKGKGEKGGGKKKGK